MSKFHKDLTIGRSGENLAVDILKQIDPNCDIEQDKDKRYDYDIYFAYNRKRYTIEVKYDLMAARTGNIAIEFHNPNSDKPTGICVTQADFWVHILSSPSQLWIIRTKKLKDIIKMIEPHKIISNAGDNGAASLYLYKKDILTEYFHELTIENVKEVIHALTTTNKSKTNNIRN